MLLAIFGSVAIVKPTPRISTTCTQSDTKTVNPLMRDGAGTAFLAGLLLVGVLESLGSPDHAKIGVKFAIGLVILVLVMVNMRKPSIPQGLYLGLLALTIANIAVAVFWSPVHS